LVSGKLHQFKTVDDAYSFYIKHDSED
jgi:hypothetical protein